MWLAPDKPDHDERTFECAECNHSVTERWRDFIPNICPRVFANTRDRVEAQTHVMVRCYRS